MDLMTDAVIIDELLIKRGITDKYIISAIVANRSYETLEDAGNVMLEMSKEVVATCFPTQQLSWPVFQSSGLPKRMGYYFQENRSPPSLVASASREAQPVRCVETGEKYFSAKDVAFASGVPVRSVYAHLAGDYAYPTVKGYTYVWDNQKEPPAPRPPKPHGSVARSVECIETGEKYPSAVEAAKAFNCNLNSLYSHLRGDIRYRKIKDHSFRYA